MAGHCNASQDATPTDQTQRLFLLMLIKRIMLQLLRIEKYLDGCVNILSLSASFFLFFISGMDCEGSRTRPEQELWSKENLNLNNSQL